MNSRPNQNRLGRRITFELCEPRQMLSAAPVDDSETAFAVHTFELNLTSFTTFVSNTGNGFSDGQFISLNDSTVASVHGNMYGGNTLSFGDAFSDYFLLQATPHGIPQAAYNGAWQVIQPPQLDPFPSGLPGFSPIRHDAAESAFVSFPISSPVSVNSNDPVTSLLSSKTSVSGSTLKSESSGNVAGGGTRGQWLSATFSPVEQHRLDATTVDADYEQTMATRDPRSRFTLEPTRVTSQTFCVVANARSSGHGDKAEPTARSIPRQPDTSTGKALPVSQPRYKPKLEAAKTSSPEIRDAAILHWESPSQPTLSVPIPAIGISDQVAAHPELSIDSRQDLEDIDFAPNNAIVHFLDENKYSTGVVLAAFTTSTMLSYGTALDSGPRRVRLHFAREEE